MSAEAQHDLGPLRGSTWKKEEFRNLVSQKLLHLNI